MHSSLKSPKAHGAKIKPKTATSTTKRHVATTTTTARAKQRLAHKLTTTTSSTIHNSSPTITKSNPVPVTTPLSRSIATTSRPPTSSSPSLQSLAQTQRSSFAHSLSFTPTSFLEYNAMMTTPRRQFSTDGGHHTPFTRASSQQRHFATKAKMSSDPITTTDSLDFDALANLDGADLDAEIQRIQRELAELEGLVVEAPIKSTKKKSKKATIDHTSNDGDDSPADTEAPVKKERKTRSKKVKESKETLSTDTNSTESGAPIDADTSGTEKTEVVGNDVDGPEEPAAETQKKKQAKEPKKKATPTPDPDAAAALAAGAFEDKRNDAGLISQTVTISALQGAKVKRNSAAANRAKLAAAATVAAQAAVDSISHDDIATIPPPDTVVVNDYASAQRVLAILTRPDVKNRYHACDTETTGIDPKIQSPVGNGTVICASIYVGPDVDFGGGARIWIDNYGKASGTLDYFKGYFEDLEIKKVWHNYSFDRHILYNHKINCIGFGGDTMHMARLWNSGRAGEGANYGLESLTRDLVTEIPGKESMTTRFGHKKILKNGDEGKVTIVPGTLELQLGESTRTEWIDYSVRDAQATWYLRERLQRELEQWPWTGNMTMMEFYKRYWLPFGEMLTDMERVGIHVRRNDYLPELRKKAEADRVECEEKFLQWAKKVKPECQYMNLSSEQQKQQLFFAPTDEKDKYRSGLEMSREFETENTWGYIEPGKAKPKKNFKFTLTGFGLPVTARTPLGKPQINMVVLKELAGSPFGKTPKYGTAYDFFGGNDVGREACEAMYQLIKLAGIEITISTFIDPLTVMPDQNDRVHCSLNLNTETGRLSARKPNLQNQPSMDKDVYKIRDAFSAEAGNKLIVSDYGQLELRVLAHITKCKSMLEAFSLGGDFHSRTAMGMYKYVSEAVSKGDVLLEWDFTDGEPPKPLLKDKYGNERKKAKILNFSIAYGKTARGLAQDFGVSVDEAKETVDAWYADRPEVLEWQKKTISEARRTGVTRTLMGRYRPLHGINDARPFARGHAERMAINTPVQGGAADLVAAAMIKLHLNEEFKQLGYKIVLQVHDELIVEGPEKNVERAYEVVRECMEHPFKQDLLVKLVVDSNIANTWYEGK